MNHESTLRLLRHGSGQVRSGRASSGQVLRQSSGQVVIILLLVMVVSLAIGLSVVGRSLTEISTSTNSENSSRAFSAAEAGIEKLLYNASQNTLAPTGVLQPVNNLTNQSQAQISWDIDLPKTGLALEYPPFGRESFAQFWLANPETLASSYTANNFDIYFGDPNYDYTSQSANYPAVEVHVIGLVSGAYVDKSYFSDSSCTSGLCARSQFPACSRNPVPIQTNNNPDTQKSLFLCKTTISGYPVNNPIMVRVRMLFTNISHPVALRPTSGSLPLQAKVFNSKGTSGNVQRNMKVFQEEFVMPHIFDYAIFSLGELNKTP